MANRRITKKKQKMMERKACRSAVSPAREMTECVNMQPEAAAEDVMIAKAETSAAEEKIPVCEPETSGTAENVPETNTAGKAKTKKMKSRLFVQYKGHEFEEQEILAQIKQIWKEGGNMMKDLKDLDIYVKPEDGKVYYTINGEISGSLPVFG